MITCSLPSCPICGEGHLHAEVQSNSVEYKGVQKDLPLHIAVCDVCGIEQAGSEEARANKRAMLAFRKEVDGILTGEQIRTFRERHRISQTQAAKIFGGGPVAFSKYENDDVAQSEAMDKLLRLADAVPAAFAWLASSADELEVARRAQVQTFTTWTNSFANLAKPVRLERSTISARQTETFTLAVSANDHGYGQVRELASVGG